MSRLSLLNSPLLLGFEEIERTLDRLAKAGGDGYPPYNIEQTGQDALRITFAVAGFSQSELDVTLEDRQLVIRGHQADDKERVFIYIAVSRRGSFSAPSCWPTAWRLHVQALRTAS